MKAESSLLFFLVIVLPTVSAQTPAGYSSAAKQSSRQPATRQKTTEDFSEGGLFDDLEGSARPRRRRRRTRGDAEMQRMYASVRGKYVVFRGAVYPTNSQYRAVGRPMMYQDFVSAVRRGVVFPELRAPKSEHALESPAPPAPKKKQRRRQRGDEFGFRPHHGVNIRRVGDRSPIRAGKH